MGSVSDRAFWLLAQDEIKRNENHGGSGNGGGNDGSHHPLIQGLLVTLPKPGTEWTVKERMNWLIMANSIFKAVYSIPEANTREISITIADDENK